MIRALLTGMSGTGKSTLIGELAARGHKAVDLDAAEWSHWVDVAPDGDPAVVGTPVEPGRDWVWREDRVRTLLATEDADVLFVAGCSMGMGRFRPSLDHVLLLTAPKDVIVRRLATRTGNPYGRRPEEVARVLDLIDVVEPRLRAMADHVIDTSGPLPEVVARVLGAVVPRG